MGQKSEDVSLVLENLRGSINRVEQSLTTCQQTNQECIRVFAETPPVSLPKLDDYLKQCESRQRDGYRQLRIRGSNLPQATFPGVANMSRSDIENVVPQPQKNNRK